LSMLLSETRMNTHKIGRLICLAKGALKRSH
jgi:hypothetical protein